MVYPGVRDSLSGLRDGLPRLQNGESACIIGTESFQSCATMPLLLSPIYRTAVWLGLEVEKSAGTAFSAALPISKSLTISTTATRAVTVCNSRTLS